GIRTLVVVPMLKDDELIGLLTIYRQEVRPFTEKQIELVQNFATQAVIAIENARLLTELRQRTDDLTESLEQQTATTEGLQGIPRARGDLPPVFESVLRNATRLCEARFGNLFLRTNEGFRFVAVHGLPSSHVEMAKRDPVIKISEHPNTPLDRVAKTKQPVQIPDLTQEPTYLGRDRRMVVLVEGVGARTMITVPMLKEDELLGAISIYRQEVRPFTEKQIALVRNFAAQAVIAIENGRS